ncbi:cupin domain-containing protein [Sphingopyxis yananensis]|uniref:cupin n=1 Tax=Sphingopyxis yananensis TaxID=2886687 RepID=UPI001D0FF859|nr:cupin [Sphingopyxis yananensis]MCC2601154.1 cupin [Sphingopyxis yananensis]
MALQHAKSGEVIHLGTLAPERGATGTAALVKSDRFEAIHLVVPAGSTIPPHHVAGYLTLHCLEGRVTLGPSDIELVAGDWVYLERGDQHSVQGIEDARLLLTILFDTQLTP